ncbi:hypothetical protein IAT38_005454 [Cryptococcus sp. DSM 104549]
MPSDHPPASSSPFSSNTQKTRYYEFYRRSSVGMALLDSLDEMIRQGQMSTSLAILVLQQSDSGTFSHVDDVWTFVLKRCHVKLDDTQEEPLHLQRLKIVACKSSEADKLIKKPGRKKRR